MPDAPPPGDQLEQLAALIAGSPHNLVSRRDRARLRDLHIPECGAIAAALPVRAGDPWMDLGTGGGLPGLVCAVIHPDAKWTLVDATRKKVGAVAGFAAALGLSNVRVVHGRAEDLARRAEHRQAYAGVVSRALGRLAIVCELSRGFVRESGVVVAVRGPAWADEVQATRRARHLLRLGAPEVAVLASTERTTALVSMPAVGPVPRAYPRAAGIPERQPLGG